MANYEVDTCTWIQNMVSASAATPGDHSNASGTENTTKEGATDSTPGHFSISEGDRPIQSHTGFGTPPQETAGVSPRPDLPD